MIFPHADLVSIQTNSPCHCSVLEIHNMILISSLVNQQEPVLLLLLLLLTKRKEYFVKFSWAHTIVRFYFQQE